MKILDFGLISQRVTALVDIDRYMMYIIEDRFVDEHLFIRLSEN